jgi:acetoin utilization protein AcuC
MKKLLVYSPKYRDFSYGSSHPLRPTRLHLTTKLMEYYGLLEGSEIEVTEPVPAEESDISRVHSQEYIEALKRANDGEFFEGALSYGLGFSDNPIFKNLFEWSMLVVGGTLKATRTVAKGEVSLSFHTGGGFHHAHRSRASGFCYLNDVSIAIAEQADAGKKVLYLDVDAHHGDGVQETFYDSARVLTISIHETPDHLFPGTGYVNELGEGEGMGFAINIPLAPGTTDSIHHEAFEAVVPPLLESFGPDLVVLQLGVDSMSGDPLAHLKLTTASLEHALKRIRELYKGGLVALGGGGYNMDTVARSWALAWSIFTECDVQDSLPEEYIVLRSEYGATGAGQMTLRDPVPDPEPDQDVQREYLNTQIEFLRKHGIIP